MKYNFTMTEDDYLKFNVENYKYSHAYKVIFKFIVIFVVIFTILMSYVFFYYSLKNSMPRFMPMIETAFLVIFDFVYLFIATRPKNMNKSISRSCKRTLKMLKKDGKLPYSQHYTVDFLDDEYIETTENSVSHIKYGDVNKVIYSDDALYLFIDAQRATVILYSCLGEDKQKIIDFIKQKTKG